MEDITKCEGDKVQGGESPISIADVSEQIDQNVCNENGNKTATESCVLQEEPSPIKMRDICELMDQKVCNENGPAMDGNKTATESCFLLEEPSPINVADVVKQIDQNACNENGPPTEGNEIATERHVLEEKPSSIQIRDIFELIDQNVCNAPTQMEVPDLLWRIEEPFESKQIFLKGCKWSPDGTCLLLSSDDNTLRLFELPLDLIHKSPNVSKLAETPAPLPVLSVPQGGLIYDYVWYPLMDSRQPATSCWLSTSAGSPVQLWDAFTGQLRASYLPYNYADEVTSAYSVAFKETGDKILCGFANQVKIFDTQVPGRKCFSINTKEVSRQKGIVSCLADNPTISCLFALGTYRKSIGLYTYSGENVCVLEGHQGGVTQLVFSPDGQTLYSGARKDADLVAWDLRKPGNPLFIMKRCVATNQRIYFDITPRHDACFSGGTDGVVRAWKIPVSDSSSPDLAFAAHADCVNGISINRVFSVLATSSGQRHFPEVNSEEDDEIVFLKAKERPENTVKIWWTGPPTLKS